MKLARLFDILLLIKVTAVVGNLKPKDASHQELFTDFEERSSPLYLCDGYSMGLRYQIPAIPECPDYNNMMKKSKAVWVTPYWPDNSITLEGFHCSAVSYIHTKFRSIWFQDSEQITFTEAPKFNRAACEEMVQRRVTPDGQRMERLAQGQFGTSIKKEPATPWPTSQTKELNTNYYVYKIEIAVDHSSGFIRTATPTLNDCNVEDAVCSTDDGLLVWSPPPHPLCALSQKKASSCLLIEDRILCPDTEFMYTGIKQKQICGDLTVAVSEQNVVLAGIHDGELVGNSASSQTIDKFLGNRNSSRQKRSTISAAKEDSGVVTMQELNLKNSYVYHLIESGEARDVKKLAHDVCKNTQDIYNMALYFAESGHPMALGRLVTRNPGIVVELNGDALEVGHCKVITRYHFLPRTTCIKEFPIRYVVDHDQKTGFVEPLSHRILQYPTYQPCSSDPFLFNMGGKLIQLGNNTAHIANLPVLPIKTNFSVPHNMHQIHLSAHGVHSRNELFGNSDIVANNMLEHVANTVLLKRPMDAQQKSFVEKLEEYFYSPLTSWLYKILGVALAVFFLINLPSIVALCKLCTCRKLRRRQEHQDEENGPATNNFPLNPTFSITSETLKADLQKPASKIPSVTIPKGLLDAAKNYNAIPSAPLIN